MSKRFGISLLAILPLLFLSKTAFTAPLYSSINKLLTDNTLNAGIIIENPSNGKILYQNNQNRLFTPASNMKLFTAYSALKILGPKFIFQTAIYADTSHLVNGTLQGNVYLQFTGDPSLTHQQLDLLIAALSKAGVQRINGQFIIVNQSLDDMGYGPGWMLDDANYCDGEAINGMVIDHNCFSVLISPSEKINEPALIQTKNTILPLKIINQITTADPNTACSMLVRSDNNKNYVLQGCINQNTDHTVKQRQMDVAIRDVNNYIAQLIQLALQNNHITFSGQYQFGQLNPSLKPLLVINSQPLPELLTTMLKNSDNLYANILFKKMGQISSGNLGSWQNSQAAVKDVIQTQLGINPKTWIVVDGSGESRYNLVTPNQILTLLNAVYKDPALSTIFIHALPISGTDGTLENRMTDALIKGHVMAKTGSMTGVSSLSGYIKTRQDKTLIFSILMNNFIGSEDTYRGMQDKICEYLAQK